MLNPDGVSVKGCDVIYAPKGQALEYAPLTCSPYRGCGHRCVYCYVPAAIHISRAEFDAGADPKKNYLDRLTAEASKYAQHGIRAQVLMSFTTDPYNPDDVRIGLTREVIRVLHSFGLGVCTLTKGGHRALRDLDLFDPATDAFASTLTTLSAEQSRAWEPHAALPTARVETLQRFHDAGIFTWVSLEPVFDVEQTLAIIRATAPFVDLYKVGKINYHRIARDIDWCRFTADVTALLAELGKRHYIKRDLQPFLPDGYDNPLRVDQVRA